MTLCDGKNCRQLEESLLSLNEDTEANSHMGSVSSSVIPICQVCVQDVCFLPFDVLHSENS